MGSTSREARSILQSLKTSAVRSRLRLSWKYSSPLSKETVNHEVIGVAEASGEMLVGSGVVRPVMAVTALASMRAGP